MLKYYVAKIKNVKEENMATKNVHDEMCRKIAE